MARWCAAPIRYSGTPSSTPAFRAKWTRWLRFRTGMRSLARLCGTGGNAVIRRCWFLRGAARRRRAIRCRGLQAAAASLRSDGLRVRWSSPANVNASSRGSASRHRRRNRTASHITSALGSGGAERQLCNTAIRQHQAGLPVPVILAEPPDGPSGYYLPLLQAAGVPVHVAGSSLPDTFPDTWARHNLPQEAFLHLHQDFRPSVLDLLGDLLLQPPELLHCWLDYTNVAGLVAAQLCGVPRVVMSLRSVNPEQTPRLLTPWMQSWYGVAPNCPGSSLSPIQPPARDYERWLGLQSGHIDVLHNALAPPPTPKPVEIDAFRREQGLSPSTPVIAGVFRLAPEAALTFPVDRQEDSRADSEPTGADSGLRAVGE